jgi:hypothetical protein
MSRLLNSFHPYQFFCNFSELANLAAQQVSLFGIHFPRLALPNSIDRYHPEIKRFSIKEYEDQPRLNYIATAPNFEVIIWKWEDCQDSDFVCLPILNNQFVFGDPYWADYYPFLRIDKSKRVVQFEFDIDAVPAINIDQELIWVGGHDTYGHWIADMLPPALMVADLISDSSIPFFTVNIRPWQLDTFAYLLPNYSYYNINLSPYPPGPLKLRFRKLWICDNLSTGNRYSIFRRFVNRGSVRTRLGRHEHPKKLLLYFSRSSLGSSKPPRVFNQDLLIKTVYDLGGIVVDPAELSIRQKIDLLNLRDNLIVNEPGSGEFNFHLFASSKSKLIQLVPLDTLTNPNHQSLYAGFKYALPRLDDITYLTGTTVDQPGRMRNGYTDLAVYDEGKLYRLISEFFETH